MKVRAESTLEEVFGPGGLLRQSMPEYEHRPSQLEMARAVLDAIQNRRHLCVEAGTGTGKTLAYLIPALFSRKRVVVSTATKNLQEQLYHKDIPLIRRLLFPDLTATYMKGRQNYLCLKRLEDLERQGSIFPELRTRHQEISRWAAETETGDRSELSWLRDDDPNWWEMDARSDRCLGQKCSEFSRCFVTRMRQKAFESDILIINHALLFANLAIQTDEVGRVLPDFSVLILDEGHEVEDVAADYFSTQISNYQLDEFCSDFMRIFAGREECSDAQSVEDEAGRFFALLPGGEGKHSLNFFRRSDGWIVDLRSDLREGALDLRRQLMILYHRLERTSQVPAEGEPLVRRLENLAAALEAIFETADDHSVYWFEKRGRGVFLHVTPIDIAPILKERLFDRIDAAILTSATLATQGNFSYVRRRLGIPDPEELLVPGEFDYARQAILYVPNRFPEPRSPQYLLRALREIRQILEITQGHAFLLFTSFQQMERVHSALLNSIPYPLLRQGDMPKNELLEVFKRTDNAVLCATSSFWQGVDVRGDRLRAVVIDKLPFQVPTEPVVAARLNFLEREGQNAFYEYSVPEAIISLKQGLGRLIRSRQDRGILAVLDSRLRSRSYGRLFLDSLPDCPITDNIGDLKNFFCGNSSSSLRRSD